MPESCSGGAKPQLGDSAAGFFKIQGLTLSLFGFELWQSWLG